MTKLTETHETLAEESKWDFSDLNALFINCTLKRSPEVSNTSGLSGPRSRDHGAQRRLSRRRASG